MLAQEHQTDGSGGRSGPVTVAVVTEFDLIRKGVESMLRPFASRVTVVALEDGPVTADVALVDSYGFANLGIDRLSALAASSTVGAAVLYAAHLEPEVVERVLGAGAAGVVAKAASAEQLVSALEGAAAGRTGLVSLSRGRRRSTGPWPGSELGLSERESEIAVFLCAGLGNRGIAEAMLLSENTVKSHLKSVFHKINVSTRSQAVARLITTPSFRRVEAGPAAAPAPQLSSARAD